MGFSISLTLVFFYDFVILNRGVISAFTNMAGLLRGIAECEGAKEYIDRLSRGTRILKKGRAGTPKAGNRPSTAACWVS